MNLFALIRLDIINIVRKELEIELVGFTNFDSIVAEPVKGEHFGDVATNVAMVLAKHCKMAPFVLAEKLAPSLQELPWLTKLEIVKPGFINIQLNNSYLYKNTIEINKQGIDYGQINLGNNKKINIEYVSANPTGPMHIGHARGAVYGDALCSLLTKAGYDVTKEYYVNDAGVQIDVLSKSAYLRYKEAAGENIGEIPQGLYPGSYLIPVGKDLFVKYGKSLLDKTESEYLEIIKPFVIAKMLKLIKSDLLDLKIKHDVFTSEQELHNQNKIAAAIELLNSKNLIYKGILEAPKGKKPDDWEMREQLLFKASEFGDDTDRPLQKSDGAYTYFAADIAYHYDKLQRNFNDMVLVLGADHGGYIKRLKAIVAALSDNKARVEVKITQIVNFMESGVAMKMSKRAGSFTTVRDVIDAVGSDIIRFIMLTRKNDAVLDFDLDLVKKKSQENPVFYVQYAHARCCSVLRQAEEVYPNIESIIANLKAEDLVGLTDNAELKTLLFLSNWPRTIELAAIACEPHRIAFYLEELASRFHSLWNKGKDDAMLRFIILDKKELTFARLALVYAVRNVIASGLHLLGVEPMQIME